MSPSSVHNVIRGYKNPSIEFAKKIAMYLEVDLDNYKDAVYREGKKHNPKKFKGKHKLKNNLEESGDWQGLDFSYV